MLTSSLGARGNRARANTNHTRDYTTGCALPTDPRTDVLRTTPGNLTICRASRAAGRDDSGPGATRRGEGHNGVGTTPSERPPGLPTTCTHIKHKGSNKEEPARPAAEAASQPPWNFEAKVSARAPVGTNSNQVGSNGARNRLQKVRNESQSRQQ